ncbi:hypothetical protein VPH35_059361 [Triticum aestivum]
MLLPPPSLTRRHAPSHLLLLLLRPRSPAANCYSSTASPLPPPRLSIARTQVTRQQGRSGRLPSLMEEHAACPDPRPSRRSQADLSREAARVAGAAVGVHALLSWVVVASWARPWSATPPGGPSTRRSSCTSSAAPSRRRGRGSRARRSPVSAGSSGSPSSN